MEPTKRLFNEIIFSNINYLISNKITELSGTSIAYLEKAVQYFSDLIKSIESLAGSSSPIEEENSSYFIFPDLKKVVSSVPDTRLNITEKSLSDIKKYFSETISNIENLKNDPKKFYDSDQSEKLNNFAKSLSSIHSEVFFGHTFETEETYRNSYYLC